MYELNESELASVVGGGVPFQDNDISQANWIAADADAIAKKDSTAVAFNVIPVTQTATAVNIFSK